MTKELEALLTELYVLIDDQVVEPRHGRGRRPELSDSELLSLAVAQLLLGSHSERRWVWHAHGNADLRRMFPYVPQQPGYHKRLKASRGLLCNTIRALARVCPSWSDDMWIIDQDIQFSQEGFQFFRHKSSAGALRLRPPQRHASRNQPPSETLPDVKSFLDLS